MSSPTKRAIFQIVIVKYGNYLLEIHLNIKREGKMPGLRIKQDSSLYYQTVALLS